MGARRRRGPRGSQAVTCPVSPARRGSLGSGAAGGGRGGGGAGGGDLKLVPCFEDVDTLRLSEGKSDSSSLFFSFLFFFFCFRRHPPLALFYRAARPGASPGGGLAAAGRALRGLSKQELSRACRASRPAPIAAGKRPGEPGGGPDLPAVPPQPSAKGDAAPHQRSRGARPLQHGVRAARRPGPSPLAFPRRQPAWPLGAPRRAGGSDSPVSPLAADGGRAPSRPGGLLSPGRSLRPGRGQSREFLLSASRPLGRGAGVCGAHGVSRSRPARALPASRPVKQSPRGGSAAQEGGWALPAAALPAGHPPTQLRGKLAGMLATSVRQPASPFPGGAGGAPTAPRRSGRPRGGPRAVPRRAGRDRPPLTAGSGAPSPLPARLCPRDWGRGAAVTRGRPSRPRRPLARGGGGELTWSRRPGQAAAAASPPPRPGAPPRQAAGPLPGPLCSLKGVPGRGLFSTNCYAEKPVTEVL
ncbi:uncharacterized protein LJ206_018059 [Theristicus caerulescens]